ncbi:MAG: hypothetical protein ACPG19_07715 [Saprospiraceae bacterium]
MKLNSIWTYVIVFLAVFAVTFVYKYNSSSIEVEDFDTFYERFLTDSTFQMSRIHFPLQGLPANADSVHFAAGYSWEAHNWDIHKKIDYASLGYQREVQKNSDYLITENLINPQGYGVQRRFMVDSKGKWFMIYYAAPNAVKQNNLRAG